MLVEWEGLQTTLASCEPVDHSFLQSCLLNFLADKETFEGEGMMAAQK